VDGPANTSRLAAHRGILTVCHMAHPTSPFGS
jgi:hypothetical protein